MADIRSRLWDMNTLEQLATGRSAVHRLHPLVKLLTTLFFLVVVVSFDRYALGRLIPFVFYPVVVMAVAEIPYGLILKRTLVALPFGLFAGLSNVWFDRGIVARMGSLGVTGGVLSLLTILLRTLLCVAAVLILVAVTPFHELTSQLRRLRVPEIFVGLFDITYRYIGTLLEEAFGMHTAYRLRSREAKGLQMRHMGPFIGHLLIRSADRAERVYAAMKCRGYPHRQGQRRTGSLRPVDWGVLAGTCGGVALLRLVDVPELLAGLVGRMLA
jgi:cobalt/nickel transport system permease protein